MRDALEENTLVGMVRSSDDASRSAIFGKESLKVMVFFEVLINVEFESSPGSRSVGKRSGGDGEVAVGVVTVEVSVGVDESKDEGEETNFCLAS